MRDKQEMKPCFCGRQPHTWSVDIHVGLLWWAGCACGLRIPDDYYTSEDDAIAKWNECVESGDETMLQRDDG